MLPRYLHMVRQPRVRGESKKAEVRVNCRYALLSSRKESTLQEQVVYLYNKRFRAHFFTFHVISCIFSTFHQFSDARRKLTTSRAPKFPEKGSKSAHILKKKRPNTAITHVGLRKCIIWVPTVPTCDTVPKLYLLRPLTSDTNLRPVIPAQRV